MARGLMPSRKGASGRSQRGLALTAARSSNADVTTRIIFTAVSPSQIFYLLIRMILFLPHLSHEWFALFFFCVWRLSKELCLFLGISLISEKALCSRAGFSADSEAKVCVPI